MLYRWSEYEETIAWLDKSPEDIRDDFAEKGRDWLTGHSLLEAWYFSHDCFLEPGQLLANAQALTMPVHIIQSRYDLVCPGRAALSPGAGRAGFAPALGGTLGTHHDRTRASPGAHAVEALAADR